MQRTMTMRHGIAIFILSLITLFTLGFWLQTAWGLYGLAMTELLILLLALIPARIYKMDFSQVFPVKRPEIRHLSGSLLIWAGAYLVVMLVTQATLYFFPEGLLNVSDSIAEMAASTPVLVSFMIAALMPAVCEELLHRGLIQYTSRMLGTWQRILLMGFLFGLFHLDPYRFLPTAILGMAFTYAMIRTGNILIPILMHLVNNSLAVFSSFAIEESIAPTSDQISLTIGTFFIFAAFVPFTLLLGVKLLNKKGTKTFTKLRTGLAVLISVSCILAGGSIISGHDMNNEPLFTTNMSLGVNHESSPHVLPFTVEHNSQYDLDLAMEIEEGFIAVSIVDADGAAVFETTAPQLTLTQAIILVPGEYQLTVNFVFDELIEDYVNCTVRVLIR